MIGRISYLNTPPQYAINNTKSRPNFKGRFNVETISNTHIGNSLNGLLGNIKVKAPDTKQPYLKVLKNTSSTGEEYRVLDKSNKLIGILDLVIRKDNPSYYQPKGDNSHVFIRELKNFSTPRTPYHNKELPKYGDVGTRLMQIALKRSIESGCSGNIKLIAKGESKPFYENVIKMVEEFPEGSPERRFNNPNTMFLPKEAQEHLKNLHGGL